MPEGRGVEFSRVQPACAALASFAKCWSSLTSLSAAALAAILAALSAALAAILAALSAAILAALSAAFSEDDIDFVEEICYKWY